MIWFLTEMQTTKSILTRKKKKSNLNSIKPPDLTTTNQEIQRAEK